MEIVPGITLAPVASAARLAALMERASAPGLTERVLGAREALDVDRDALREPGATVRVRPRPTRAAAFIARASAPGTTLRLRGVAISAAGAIALVVTPGITDSA